MTQAANGSFLFPGLPAAVIGAGVRTPIGSILPPGANVAAYVRSAGAISGEDPQLAVNGRVVKTLAAALPYCRSGKGDYIVVLPGHTENVSTATALTGLVAGTRIVGVGSGSMTPTFSWSATTSQWAISVNDVSISGLKLDLGQANGVTKAIAVTGSTVQFTANTVVTTTDGTHKSTLGIEVGSGADDFLFAYNKVTGASGTASTDFLKVVAAVNRFWAVDNVMQAACTAANGLIDVTAAALDMFIARNYIANTVSASSACIAIGNVAATGIIADNYLSVLNNGTAASQGVTMGGASLVRCFQNFCSDEPNKSGALAPAVVAT